MTDVTRTFEEMKHDFVQFLSTGAGDPAAQTEFLQEFYKLSAEHRMLGTINGLAQAWLGLRTEHEDTYIERAFNEMEDSRFSVRGYDFIYRWRAPLVLVEDNGWIHEGEFRESFEDPTTGENTLGMGIDNSALFLNEEKGLGFEMYVTYSGEVVATAHYDESKFTLDQAIKELRATIEQPNPYKGKVCRYNEERGMSVIRLPDEEVSGYDDDVEEAVAWLTTIADKDVQDALGAAHLPKRAGLLLEGPPGSGKTTLVRRIARELVGDVTIIYIDPRSNIQTVFKMASNFEPVMFVFEDIEAFIGSRGDDEFTEFLNAVDGLTQDVAIMILATTNDSSEFDHAVRRAGRLERRAVIKSVHPNAKIGMVRSRFPNEDDETIKNILDVIERRCSDADADVTPAIIDSLCRHVIMLKVNSEDIAHYADTKWQPVWEGKTYLED